MSHFMRTATILLLAGLLVLSAGPASRAADLSTAAEAERAREYLAKGRKPLISGDSFHARNEGF